MTRIDDAASTAKTFAAKAGARGSEIAATVTSAEHKIQEAAKDGVHRLQETAEKAGHAVKETAEKAGHVVQETASKVKHSAQEAAQKVHRREGSGEEAQLNREARRSIRERFANRRPGPPAGPDVPPIGLPREGREARTERQAPVRLRPPGARQIRELCEHSRKV